MISSQYGVLPIPKDEVISFVNRFHIIHRAVIVKYLTKLYEMSEMNAERAIYKACLSRGCYEKEKGFIVDSPFRAVNNNAIFMSRALSVAIEFMSNGDADFMEKFVTEGNNYNSLLMLQLSPTDEDFEKDPSAQGKLLDISYISRGNEVVSSMALCTTPIPAEIRPYLYRIACVDSVASIDNIRRAGYYFFVPFKKDEYTFSTSDIVYAEGDLEARWRDVPEK